MILDSGNYPGAMRKLLDLVGYADFPRLQAEALREGRRIGLGLGQELVAEGCSLPTSLLVAGYDGATVRVNPSGQVTVLTGVTSPGSGNETAIAQVAADTLGVDVNTVRVIQGDTETCPVGARQLQLARGHHGRLRHLRRGERAQGKNSQGRGPHARGSAGRPGMPGRQNFSQGRARALRRVQRGRPHHLQRHLRNSRQGDRTGTRGDALLPPSQHLPGGRSPGPLLGVSFVAQCGGRRDRRSRSRHRRAQTPAGLHGSRQRRRGQPDAGRGQRPRRYRARHRRRDLRTSGVRRERPVQDRHLHGLHAADRGRDSAARTRASGNALAVHAAGDQGSRRIGRA